MIRSVTPETEGHTFRSLDGLRGIAALSVVCFHYRVYMPEVWPRSAYLAVDLFFLISGFVLSHAYSGRLSASLSVGRFMLARLVRLYPLYLFGTAIAISISLFGVLLGVSHRWTLIPFAVQLLPALLMLPSLPNAAVQGKLYP